MYKITIIDLNLGQVPYTVKEALECLHTSRKELYEQVPVQPPYCEVASTNYASCWAGYRFNLLVERQ